MNLCSESLKCLLRFWTGERNYARDCRWTQAKFLKKEPERKMFWGPRYLKWDRRYKKCDRMVREIRKQITNQSSRQRAAIG